MKYLVRIDYHIEAKDVPSAGDSLMYGERTYDKVLVFNDYEEANNAYCEAVKGLQPPKKLKHNLYWFSGASLVTEATVMATIRGTDKEIEV